MNIRCFKLHLGGEEGGKEGRRTKIKQGGLGERGELGFHLEKKGDERFSAMLGKIEKKKTLVER